MDGRVSHLAGTLYVPDKTGRHPGVVMVPGSGPTDRNGNNKHIPGPVDNFKVLGRRLAGSGMVVLAYDKRGVGATPEDPAPGEETPLEDVGAAFDFLKARPEVDPHCVALLGHSQGGGLCLRTAVSRPDVAALVLLSTSGRPARAVFHDQIRDGLAAEGVAGQVVETNLRHFDMSIKAILTDKPLPEPGNDINPGVVELIQKLAEKPELRGCGACGTRMFENPADYVRKLKIPLMVVNGGRDAQTGRKDFDALRSAAPEKTKAIMIDDMDHILKQETRCVEKLTIEELLSRYGEARPIHEDMLEEVSSFLLRSLKCR